MSFGGCGRGDGGIRDIVILPLIVRFLLALGLTCLCGDQEFEVIIRECNRRMVWNGLKAVLATSCVRGAMDS